MDKSLETLLRFCGVFQVIQVQTLPSPHKQRWTRVSRIFSAFQLCIGLGEGELQEISKMMHCFKEGTEKWRKNMNIAVLSQGNQIPGQKYRNQWWLKERKVKPSNIPTLRSRPCTNDWIKNKMITRMITTELFINSTLSRMTYWKAKRESWWRISLCKCILETCINSLFSSDRWIKEVKTHFLQP